MNLHPDDRPTPAEQPLRARVPDHVSGGAFSTGVIVMTAQTEFILDFVQNLGRPHQIVARVIMPHNVLPQLVDALQRNIDLYKGRWGELPTTASSADNKASQKSEPAAGLDVQCAGLQQQNPDPGSPRESERDSERGTEGAGQGPAGSASSPKTSGNKDETTDGGPTSGGEGPSESSSMGSGARQATAQEVYDDLKIKDELLSGAYANAVMIGHGPHEFSFDFITNFYPHSAVSSRVFLAAGQVPRLYDSLKGTWEQLRARMRRPGDSYPGDSPEDLPPENEY